MVPPKIVCPTVEVRGDAVIIHDVLPVMVALLPRWCHGDGRVCSSDRCSREEPWLVLQA